MDLERAREFLREHQRGVLATRRSGGGIQQSPVIAAVDGEGRVVISSERRVLIRIELSAARPDLQG